jgi:hypothetical protein
MRSYLKRTILMALSLFCLGSAGCGGRDKNKIPDGYLAEPAGGPIFGEADFVSIYNYCPTFLKDGADLHVWYCSNFASNANGDHIAYRKGIEKDGVRYWGEKQIVFSPGEQGTWDAANVCDPSVIRGEFGYKGTAYTWLMAYLGCSTYGNYENSVGFAVANAATGPWVRVPEVSPLYDFYTLYPNAANDQNQWGTGQPTVLSVDKKGKVLLFYTQNFDPPEWGQMVERWDFSDMEHPARDFSLRLPGKGLAQRDGKQDYITNADFMYDEKTGKLYVGTDVHPFGPDYPNNIPVVGRVAVTDLWRGDAVLGDTLNSGVTATWKDVFQLSEALTGNKRHSNLGFIRDPYGYMPDSGKIDVTYTASDTLPYEEWRLIYTWRIYAYGFLVNP